MEVVRSREVLTGVEYVVGAAPLSLTIRKGYCTPAPGSERDGIDCLHG